MQNKMIPGWGMLATIFLAMLAGVGDAGDSVYSVLGLSILVFGVWGGILLVSKNKK